MNGLISNEEIAETLARKVVIDGNLCQQLSAALDAAVVIIDDVLGSCPMDRFNWQHEEGCIVVCKSDIDYKTCRR